MRADTSERDREGDATAVLDCRTCGACCSYSAQWPRFTLEDDATLARIPQRYVDERQAGMRCIGDRCSALIGKIGEQAACAVHAVRPEVCRICMPGDDECLMARRALIG